MAYRFINYVRSVTIKDNALFVTLYRSYHCGILRGLVIECSRNVDGLELV